MQMCSLQSGVLLCFPVDGLRGGRRAAAARAGAGGAAVVPDWRARE